MPRFPLTTIKGLNLYQNPLNQSPGDLIQAVNVTSDPYGAKTKRPGYIPFLGTADGSAISSLFSWYKNDDTTFFLYRASGTQLYYSAQGTGAWTACTNGAVAAGARIGNAVLDNTLMICDGVGSTRHTTNGTSFTNTTLAPIAVDLTQYQNRMYAAGTSSDEFYSTTNDATNWNTSGTSDSSSFKIPGAGKLLRTFKANDKLVTVKTSGAMHRWDGFGLVDMSTDLGPSSPNAVAKTEDYFFWINRKGHVGYGGNRPELLSNAVQPLFYNASGSAMAGTVFNTAQADVHLYDFYLAMGTVTPDFTGETISNCILKYNYQKNEYLTDSFSQAPTAFHSFKDNNGLQQFIFGDGNGQCYQISGTATTDNGTAIASLLEFFTDCETPDFEKKFRYLDLFFNPGCQARVQVAIERTFHKQAKKWIDIGDVSRGHTEFRFPIDSRGEFLFLKITDIGKNAPFSFYGAIVDYELQAK